MHRLNLSKQAQKFLKTLPQKQAQQIARKIGMLVLEPRAHDSKKLMGEDSYRVDSGEYRVIYDFDELVINIVFIGKRNDGEVYKRFKRSL